MKMKTTPLIVILATCGLGGVAHAGSVRHLPPAEATAGVPLELSAEVAAAWTATLTLHYRPIGGDAWSTAGFDRRDDTGWVAVVPAVAVAVPGVEYYIDSATGEQIAPEFASAARPHPVRILRSPRDDRRDRELIRLRNRRSRVHLAGEYIDYGSRRYDGFGRRGDAYYRIDADFAYRLLAYPLEQIRFGYTRLIGDVPDTELDDPNACTADDGSADCSLHVGFKVGGWFELRLGVADGIDLDVRGMVMATEVGVGVGGRGELRFGDEDGNHVAIGAEGIQDNGASLHFRLGWDTVPRLPMAATIEVTDMPSTRRAAGVRFLYDIAYPLPTGVRIGGRVGFQGRDADVGGVSAGGNLTFDF